MSSCCEAAGCELEKLRESQSKILKIVLAVNAVMFCIEFTLGIIAGSTALLADSLDMLGDSFVYAFSLYVVVKSDGWKARAAYFKAAIMFVFGLFVLTEAIHKIIYPVLPDAELIGAMALFALAANGYCLYLLTSHRQDDVNMRSVWLRSRNDIIANLAVLCAGVAVYLVASHWPDIIVGLGIAILFIKSSIEVFMDARSSMKTYRLNQNSI